MNLIIILEEDIPIETLLEETCCSIASTSISLEHMKDVIRDSKSMSLGVSVLLLAINGFMRAIYLLQQSFQLNIHDSGWLVSQHPVSSIPDSLDYTNDTMFLSLFSTLVGIHFLFFPPLNSTYTL
ncbi:hypothetical protein NW765_012118 [Fusarium oxysporum]|nr:hypothetical protein NW765_012118 [Fusarium oxysporum]KAJ4274340.1 hypothetical protein NW764_011501 [Fusarium oxysporum]